MHITTILPVSRVEYLDRVLESLKNQTHKIDALIVIFDGPDEDYVQARNKVVLQFDNTLFIRSTNSGPAFAISERREHIANIHNQFKTLVDTTNWIFSIEDDGILPTNALERLVKIAGATPDIGLVTGVELGRWGVPYVGAWRVDDIFETTRVDSVENKAGQNLVEEIDAAGLYCALIRGDAYQSHEFGASNGLGPDVNLCLHIRRVGFKNYIDWGVPVTHLTNRNGLEMEIPATDYSQLVTLSLLGNNIWSQTKYGQTPFGRL